MHSRISPRMPGSQGHQFTSEEKDKIWNLHVQYQLPANFIAVRMGLPKYKVGEFLRKKKQETGVTVAIDRFRVQRPVL